MKGVCYNTCEVQGTTSGEHSGHIPPHPPLPITGNVISPDPFVTIEGQPITLVGNVTTENDSCCGTSSGVVSEGSPYITVNGIPIVRLDDKVTPHSGTAKMSSCSSLVYERR